MNSLGFELPEWCLPPSKKLVAQFERQFSVSLPPDYRGFLVRHGGVTGSAACPFQEPTPLGTSTSIENFYGFTSGDRHDNIGEATKLIGGAPDVIAIGDNTGGAMFWLKCTGRDAGFVYLHD